MKKVLPGWFVGLVVSVHEILFCLGPVQNIVFLSVHYLIPSSPSLSKLVRQSCWVAYLFVCVSYVSVRIFQGDSRTKLYNLYMGIGCQRKGSPASSRTRKTARPRHSRKR
jgi:hypothetical protein